MDNTIYEYIKNGITIKGDPVYAPPTEPDWDNDYYEPTPKRKLK